MYGLEGIPRDFINSKQNGRNPNVHPGAAIFHQKCLLKLLLRDCSLTQIACSGKYIGASNIPTRDGKS
jgi:hypothetical protein